MINNKDWYRDTNLKEDKFRIRINSGAIARLRTVAINILKSTKVKNIRAEIEINVYSLKR